MTPLYAQVAELVDALASGASGHYGRGSSSLLLGTILFRYKRCKWPLHHGERSSDGVTSTNISGLHLRPQIRTCVGGGENKNPFRSSVNSTPEMDAASLVKALSKFVDGGEKVTCLVLFIHGNGQ